MSKEMQPVLQYISRSMGISQRSVLDTALGNLLREQMLSSAEASYAKINSDPDLLKKQEKDLEDLDSFPYEDLDSL
jgi:hypothetical protein